MSQNPQKPEKHVQPVCDSLFLRRKLFVFSFKITDFHLQTITCPPEVTYFVFLCKLLGLLLFRNVYCNWACGQTVAASQNRLTPI